MKKKRESQSESESKVPPTPEEKLERKIRRLEGRILQLEASAKFAAEQRGTEFEGLEEDLLKHRHFIIDQLGEPLSALIQEFARDPRHIEWLTTYPNSRAPHGAAERDFIDLIVEAAEPHAFRDYERNLRARCPLCGGEPLGPSRTGGYAIPTGLDRHLIGWGNARQCFVMQVAAAEAIQYARYTLNNPTVFQRHVEREAEVQPNTEAEGAAPDDLSSHVRPSAVQRELPEDQVTVWEIESSETLEGPYSRALAMRPQTKWVRGTKVQAEYARERWMTALRWRALREGTHFWIALGRHGSVLVMMPVLNHPDEVEPSIPIWDPRKKVWRGPEPVLVDMIEGFDFYEWDRRDHTNDRRPG